MSPTPGVRSVATLMVLSSISLFLFLSLLLVSDKVLHKASTERLQSFLYTAALRTCVLLSMISSLPPSFVFYCMAPGGLQLSSSSFAFGCPGHGSLPCDPAVVHCQSSSILSSIFLFLLFFFLSSISLTPQKLSRDDTHVLKQLEEPSRLILIPAFLNTWRLFWIHCVNVIIQLL